MLYKSLDVLCCSVVFNQLEYVSYLVIAEHFTGCKGLMVKYCQLVLERESGDLGAVNAVFLYLTAHFVFNCG